MSGSRVALAAALVGLVGLVTAHRERLTVVCRRSASLHSRWASPRPRHRARAQQFQPPRGGCGWGPQRGLEVRAPGVVGSTGARLRAGTVPCRSAAAFRGGLRPDSATDDLRQAWFDAHNVVISLLVTVGLVGAALIGVGRDVGCPVQGAVGVGPGANCLHVALAAGVDLHVAARLRALRRRRPGGRQEVPMGAPCGHRSAMALGACLGMWVLMADVRLSSSERHNDPDEAVSAASMYLGDPVVDDIVGQITARSADSLETRRVVLDWRTRAVEHEPNRPYWWSSLASWQIGLDDLKAADRSIARAFALQPYNVRTEQVEAMLAYQLRDEARLTASLARLSRSARGGLHHRCRRGARRSRGSDRWRLVANSADRSRRCVAWP